MADRVHLNEAELAALDVVIEAKRHDATLFNEFSFLPITAVITRAVTVTTRITPGIIRLTPAILDYIGPELQGGPTLNRDQVLKHLRESGGKGFTVDELVKARRDAAGK
jgi:hypothetical protein